MMVLIVAQIANAAYELQMNGCNVNLYSTSNNGTWNQTGTILFPNDATTNLRVPTLASCTGDIETDADGDFACGVDVGTGSESTNLSDSNISQLRVMNGTNSSGDINSTRGFYWGQYYLQIANDAWNIANTTSRESAYYGNSNFTLNLSGYLQSFWNYANNQSGREASYFNFANNLTYNNTLLNDDDNNTIEADIDTRLLNGTDAKHQRLNLSMNLTIQENMTINFMNENQSLGATMRWSGLCLNVTNLASGNVLAIC